jgi:hypothetical protein
VLLVAALAAALALTGEATAGAAVVRIPTHQAKASTPPPTAALDPWAGEERSLAPSADGLLVDDASRLPALRSATLAILAHARNEATVEDFLGGDGATRLANGLEHFAALLPSSDPGQLALGVAGVQKYSELIHSAFLAEGDFVFVSLQAQRLVAYDRGRVVLDTLVTTGRPTLTTDIGPMHVLSKDSPWTMKSPWPKGSPLWYPDTPVAMVAWFTTTGEGLHDASWEPTSAFGPGSEDGPFASHGCVHLSLGAETVLYNWIAVGTPVVVIPGDGTPLPQQLAQRSVDNQGNPIGGVKGA